MCVLMPGVGTLISLGISRRSRAWSRSQSLWSQRMASLLCCWLGLFHLLLL